MTETAGGVVDCFRAVIGGLQVPILFLNLCLVIYFYKTTRADRKIDKLAAVDAFWLQEFVISPNRHQLTQSFSEIEELVNSFASEVRSFDENASLGVIANSRKEHIRKFNQIKATLDNAIEDVFIFDEDLGNKLLLNMQNLQDKINDGFAKILNPEDLPRLAEQVRRSKKKFLRNLYDGHKRRLAVQ